MKFEIQTKFLKVSATVEIFLSLPARKSLIQRCQFAVVFYLWAIAENSCVDSETTCDVVCG